MHCLARCLAFRLRSKLCLCLQLRALALSTVACGTIGALGYMAVKHSGLQMKDTAAVSSLHDAIGLAQQQRVSPCLPLPGTHLNVLTDFVIKTR